MDDREIIQWDKRLTDQARRGWENYKHLHLDLSVARIDQSYLIAGEFLYVEQSSSDLALAKIKLNRNNNDALDLEKGVEIETVFIEIFVTNDAIQDEWIDLVFGINFVYKKKVDGGGMIYVDRGDPNAYDWDMGDFTKDAAWHDLDLTGIIPAGALLVHGRMGLKATTSNETANFRRNGNVNIFNMTVIATQVGGLTIWKDILIAPDINGVIEYWFKVATWLYASMVIRGWFI